MVLFLFSFFIGRKLLLWLNQRDVFSYRLLIVFGLNHGFRVMDNFQLLDGTKFRTAVEVAAQNALFHVIVDTDATAAKLMTRLEKDRLGRVTFLPLNRLRDEAGGIKYPESADVTPILKRCMRYDQRVHKAMQHVFGKKLLARGVDVASTWSAQCDMDAITLEGDLCSRKGALTGGYVDHAKKWVQRHDLTYFVVSLCIAIMNLAKSGHNNHTSLLLPLDLKHPDIPLL